MQVLNSKIAYAIGLIVTDGYLSKDGRHLEWLRIELEKRLNIRGSLTRGNRVYCLRFAKSDTLKILPKMYCNNFFLKRKYDKIIKAVVFKGRMME